MSEGYPFLRVIGGNVGEDRETARRAAEELGITYPVVLDPENKVAMDYGVDSIPRFVLLDTDRTIIWQGEGFFPPTHDDSTAKAIRNAIMERRTR